MDFLASSRHAKAGTPHDFSQSLQSATLSITFWRQMVEVFRPTRYRPEITARRV